MNIRNLNESDFFITNDIVTGDIIIFTESVFGGSYRNPKYKGDRKILGKILKESYGNEKQQHTFTLEILDVEGVDFEEVLKKKTIRRKGRNIYRKGVKRMKWKNEKERCCIADEKHERGEIAREKRRLRKDKNENYIL